MLESLPHYHRIQSSYDQMWEKGSLEISRGDVDADPVPGASRGRWGVSIVARIKMPTLKPLIELARNLCGENHTFYHPGNQHITVRWCEFFRSKIPSEDSAIKAYQSALAEVALQYGPLEIALSGLNANRTGIIVQGYPTTSQLQTLRDDLHTRLLNTGLQHGSEAERMRRGAHTSLVVFGGPIKNAIGLHQWIGDNRNTWVGTAHITQLELVRYQRTQFDVEPICLFEASLRV